jgi:hypothetical protein
MPRLAFGFTGIRNPIEVEHNVLEKGLVEMPHHHCPNHVPRLFLRLNRVGIVITYSVQCMFSSSSEENALCHPSMVSPVALFSFRISDCWLLYRF